MYFPYSYLIGPFFILMFFVFSLALVIGVKYLLSFIPGKKMPSAAKKPRKTYVRKLRPVKSIEIDPQEIERIYVKKSSS